MIHVACASDAGMTLGVLALARSVAAHAQSDRPVNFHLIAVGDLAVRGQLEALQGEAFRVTIHAGAPLAHLPLKSAYSTATLQRLVLAETLPDLDRVIYLDADTLVLTDLSALFDTDLNGEVLAATPDFGIRYFELGEMVEFDGERQTAAAYLRRILPHYAEAEDYFNTGVMVIDLDRWREQQVGLQCMDLVARSPAFQWADQDALNIVLGGAFVRLDPRWNAFARMAGRVSPMGDIAEWSAVSRLWRDDARIVHFAGDGKPWRDEHQRTPFDPVFWDIVQGLTRRKPAPAEGDPDLAAGAAGRSGSLGAALQQAPGSTLYLEITDLIEHLRDGRPPTGIQRVQLELCRVLMAASADRVVAAFMLEGKTQRQLSAGALSPLLNQVLSAGKATEKALRGATDAAEPFAPRDGDVCMALGPFCNYTGSGRQFRHLNQAGVRLGVFIHDILPITHPEFFLAHEASRFERLMVECLHVADFGVVASQYNRTQLQAYLRDKGLAPLEIATVPLAQELFAAVDQAPRAAPRKRPVVGEYILCVGTLEIRKNLNYLLDVWETLGGQLDDLPKLVLVGRKGWLIDPLFDRMAASPFLKTHVVWLEKVSDAELEQLYEDCLFSVYPSLMEGWGLPIGESLSRGKLCVASSAGSMPEVGRRFAAYIDPKDVGSGVAVIGGLIADRARLARREADIAWHFRPKTWAGVALDLVRVIDELAERPFTPKTEGLTLPPNLWISPAMLGTDEGHIDPRVYLGDLACIRGWDGLDQYGAIASRGRARLQFRATDPSVSCARLMLGLFGDNACDQTIEIAVHGAESITRTLPAGAIPPIALMVQPDATGLVCIDMIQHLDAGGVRPFLLRGIAYMPIVLRTD